MARKVLYLFIVFISLSGCYNSYAQQMDINNLGSIEIDDLSDEQIKKFMDKVEGSGYTEEQLILMAKSRGMSEVQIQKLRTRMAEVRYGASTEMTSQEAIRTRTSKSFEIGSEEEEDIQMANDLFADILVDSVTVDEGLKIFGLEIFENSTLSFEPGLNMPTPTNYVLGPGDEIIIDIWGASEQTYQLVISPEGSIRVPNLGPIFLSGLQVEKAESKIISRLKKIYSTIGTSSFADVSLGQMRTINVHVIGAVKKPGTFSLSSFGTAFNALYSAGGPTEMGSLRKIEIYRSNQLFSTLDAYEFLIRGTGENITLQDQDLIIVRPYGNRIIFDGEVKTPAIYEMLEGETLEDLIVFSGGFTDKAYRGVISLRRIENNFRAVKSVRLEESKSLELFNGDEIFVGKVSNEFVNRVTIEGPVLNPGEYELKEKMTLLDLLNEADGLRGDAFMSRGVLIRKNSDFTLSSIGFDPKQILDGTVSIDLQSDDLVKFQSIYDLREEYYMTIEGEIQRPGKYAFIEGTTVENLIYLAGGFKESAARSFVEVARRINPDSTTDSNNTAEIFNFSVSKDLTLSADASKFELSPFDLVVIRKNPFYEEQEVIEIEGEVKFPGIYALDQKDERISSILNRAGGLTEFAYAKGATLIRRTEFYVPPESLIYDEEGNIIGTSSETGDAAQIRKEDLTYLFKKDTLFADSAQIFRQKESIGIELQKILNEPNGKYDLILRKGDILSIPREYQTVRIRGEVLYPSNVRHDDTFGFKKFIASAGGFDQEAKKSKSYIIYANGTSAQTKSFLFFKNYPKVEPGAEIVVPRKPERVPMTAQAWVAIGSSIATLALVIDRLTN